MLICETLYSSKLAQVGLMLLNCAWHRSFASAILLFRQASKVMIFPKDSSWHNLSTKTFVSTGSARPQLHSEAILWWGSCLQWWVINSVNVSFLIIATLPKSNLGAVITQVIWNCYCSILVLHLHKCSSIPAIGSEESFLLVCRITTTPSCLLTCSGCDCLEKSTP